MEPTQFVASISRDLRLPRHRIEHVLGRVLDHLQRNLPAGPARHWLESWRRRGLPAAAPRPAPVRSGMLERWLARLGGSQRQLQLALRDAGLSAAQGGGFLQALLDLVRNEAGPELERAIARSAPHLVRLAGCREARWQ